MDYAAFYRENETFIPELDDRLRLVARVVEERAPSTVLDVACGHGVLLDELRDRLPEARFSGTDVYEQELDGIDYRVSDVTTKFAFDADSFDLVVAGEIIEHVPDPDHFLAECRRVLRPGGTLVVTTPNLVSWCNRILVPLGIQPLFTETSTSRNLGRRWAPLGQGGPVQGHLKIFTHRSLAELLELEGFAVEDRLGAPFFFPFPLSLVDRALTRTPALASGLVYVARAA